MELDPNLKAFLTPIYLVQKVFFFPKYELKNRRLRPCSLRTQALSLFAVIAYVTICGVYMINTFHRRALHLISFHFFVNRFLGNVFYIIGFIVNFVSNIKHSSNNVNLVFKIQSAIKIVDFDGKVLRRFSFCNWYNVISHTVLFVAVFVVGSFFDVEYGALNFIFYHIVNYFYLNLICIVRMMYLIRNVLEKWIEMVKIGNVDGRGDFFEDVLKAYRDICEAYKMFVKVNQEVIVYSAVDIFGHSLVYVISCLNNTLQLNRTYQYNPYFHVMVFSTWLSANMFLMVYLGVGCEQFYRCCEEVRATCLMRLGKGCSETERRTYKKILRVNRDTRKMDAGGLFKVDARFPLRLTLTLTMNIIVMLQLGLITHARRRQATA